MRDKEILKLIHPKMKTKILTLVTETLNTKVLGDTVIRHQ